MAVSVKVELRGLDQVQDKLEDIKARMTDLSSVTKVFAEELKAEIDDAFSQSRTPWGEDWKPLKASTLEQRKRDGYGSKPLVRTGALKQRITARGDKTSVLVGASPTTPYARYQQPKRPFLPFDASGDFVEKGRMARYLARFFEAVKVWILRGERVR